MSPKSVVSLLCTISLVVSSVSRVSADYSESSHFNIFQQNAFSMQAGQTCPLSGACEVCQSAKIGSSNDYFHVCPDDGDPCNPKLCYYSPVCRCDPDLFESPPQAKCNSTTTLLVEGKTVKVAHYVIETPGTNVPNEDCFTIEPLIDSCSVECDRTCIRRRFPDPTTPPPCITDNIYFLLDGTSGNNQFCSVTAVIQVLVAAFNPGSSSSGGHVSTVLFSDGVKYNASVVFDTDSSCTNSATKLIELQKEFQECRQYREKYDRQPYASLCGQSSTAVDGLKTIHDLIISNPVTTDNTLVILTDGILRDNEEDRVNIFKSLRDPKLRIRSVIATGIEGASSLSASVDNLKLYTFNQDEQDTVLAKNPFDVGLGIVARMAQTGIVCPDFVNNVVRGLQTRRPSLDVMSNYCRCHNMVDPPKWYRCGSTRYPECGGSLLIQQPLLANPQKESLSLEDEILAAVENVLENFEG